MMTPIRTNINVTQYRDEASLATDPSWPATRRPPRRHQLCLAPTHDFVPSRPSPAICFFLPLHRRNLCRRTSPLCRIAALRRPLHPASRLVSSPLVLLSTRRNLAAAPPRLTAICRPYLPAPCTRPEVACVATHPETPLVVLRET